MAIFHSFYDWVAFQRGCVCVCMYVLHLLYPFICWWTFRFLPCLDYCEWCFCEYRVHVCFWIRIVSAYMPRSGIPGSHSNPVLSFWGSSTLFATVAAPVYIPINRVGGSLRKASRRSGRPRWCHFSPACAKIPSIHWALTLCKRCARRLTHLTFTPATSTHWST